MRAASAVEVAALSTGVRRMNDKELLDTARAWMGKFPETETITDMLMRETPVVGASLLLLLPAKLRSESLHMVHSVLSSGIKECTGPTPSRMAVEALCFMFLAFELELHTAMYDGQR